jgi:hypothetical protein
VHEHHALTKEATMKNLILLLIVLLTLTGAAYAQDMGTVTRNTYYLAADENGVQQVFTLLLGGSDAPRQVTSAESDVINFGVSYDTLAVAYISGGQLWLQPIHTETAEALAPVAATQNLDSPVFSPDGQYLAYTNNGLWLLDLATRETRQLLEDVAVAPDGSNVDEFRIYQPDVFVSDENGAAHKLIVDVGVWEWNTSGVYDLASGDFQMVEGLLHTNLLPLHGGGALLYGNSGVAGEFALHRIESLDDVNTYTQVVKFADLTDETLFAEQAVEIRPGVVRVMGASLYGLEEAVYNFTFDYDLMAGEAGEVRFVEVADDPMNYTLVGDLSPDGTLLPVYNDTVFNEAGSASGTFSLLDLTTGETVDAPYPETVGVFHWQP